MRRPSKDSIITIGILLLISIVFSVLLILDFRRRGNLGNNPIIGEVTFKEKYVHRKIDASVVWDEIESTSPVANKDTIRTLDYSDAVLTLKDGTKLRLSDNSMIYVDLSEKNLNINFDYGSISTSREDGTDPQTNLNIQSGDKVIQIENGGAAKLSKNEDENVSIQVEKGQAKLTLKGKEEVLEQNQTAELRDTKIDVKPIRFLLQYPPDGKYFSTSAESLNTDFKWGALDKGISVELQIAKDKTFKNIFKKQPGIRDTGFTLNLPAGVYFWRIGGKNPIGGRVEYSETRKITIFPEKAVVITTPQDGKIFSYSIKLPSIALRWTKNEFASSYKVDIATNPEFSSVIKSLDSIENYINTDVPFKGTFYIRITTRPRVPDLAPIVSPVSKFVVEQREVPYPPEIISPVTNANYGLDYIQKGKILFNWRDNREFATYDLELSKTPDFSSVLTVLQNIKENHIIPELREEIGDVYWRVRGTLPDGRKSDYSKVSSFKISDPAKLRLVYPTNGSELEMEYDKTVTFKWQRPETSGSFILEVASSPDFSNSLLKEEEKIVTGFSKKVTIPTEGKYYWRIKLLSRDNKEITRSEDSSFSILGAPSAKPISPSEGANIDLTNKSDIDFSWAKEEKAVSYFLEVYDVNKGQKRLIFSNTTSETSFNYKEISKLKDGSFVWNVSILYASREGKIIKSPPSSIFFNVKVPTLEAPVPVPSLPVNGADLVMGEKEEVLFQWEKNDRAVYYQIDVQEKSTERSKPVFQKQTTEPSALFEIPVTVGEGIYYWDLFIYYKTWDGRVVRSNPIRNEFTLQFPYRNPPIPVLLTPRDDQEIQPNDDWQVPLVWDKADRAISYNVAVFEYDSNKQIFKDTTEDTKSIFLVSDSAIKPGKYVWSVSVNYKAKDDRIVKSPSRKQEFNLKIPSFEVPVTVAISPEADFAFNPVGQTELEFKWEKSESALLYSIEFYELSGEGQILIAKKETKEDTFLFKDMTRLTNGHYMWKLKVAYKDRKLKTIMTEPLLTEFFVSIPAEDIIEPPTILSKPRLYVE